MKKYPVGLDYKYAAQARMHEDCGGDLKRFFRQTGGATREIRRRYGIKFHVAAPAGWTAPKVKRIMPGENDPIIAEVRRVRHKISAEHGHDTARLAKHYQEMEKELRKTGKYKFAAVK
ncbi:MAG: hypothetical protein EXS35_04250 [Pedosphaera sp.]|nr:hypothetical protein [Pedosphaera sp.]